MTNDERFLNPDDRNADIDAQRKDADERHRHPEHNRELDGHSGSHGSDAEPGPEDDDGLPENARRRVPS